VLNQQGRAYFEMNDFQSAQRCLELMQIVEPHRMKGLDLLSTVYWQLKKEVKLAHLAQRAVDFNRMSPESWCIVGNCFFSSEGA
jgi:anaphase-promoting complex subunit 3